jgi:circadian clock protein KaiC
MATVITPAPSTSAPAQLRKSPTGIPGLDEITGGGLPEGRPTIVCGGPGCGKTMLGIEFLVRGATMFDEPGVHMAFEETPQELTENVASLGFNLADLSSQNKLYLEYVHIERGEIQESGEYDLEGLFIRLGHAIDSIGAKRVVLDTLEALFSGFSNQGILRAEIRRLFRWLKDKGVTTVITAERGDGALTRYGLEEYVSDCVILLDHRVTEQRTIRRLRIVKYRGTVHGTDEYPFLIDERGISVVPITSFGLDHQGSNERISTGIADLDELLEGKGYYRGSTVLVSGVAGSGKTSMAAHFAAATCRRGERCLYLAFEESPAQVTRNMRSIGIDLESLMKQGLLQFRASRPTQHGLEMHLLEIHKVVEQFNPSVVIVDPITNLISTGDENEVKSMLMRLIDFLKHRQITALFTSLTAAGSPAEQTEVGISSLIDTWILFREIEAEGERNRGLYVVKSRGMAHSNQIREFMLTANGVKLVPPYLGMGTVLTGSARLVQEAREREEALARNQETERRKAELERKRERVEAQIAALRNQLAEEEEEIRHALKEAENRESRQREDRSLMEHSRKVKEPASENRNRKAS